MPKPKETTGKKDNELFLINSLQKTAEHWFIKGLENDVTPHIMGCLHDPIESKRQECIDMQVFQKKG